MMKLWKKLRKKLRLFYEERKIHKKAQQDFPLPTRTLPYNRLLKIQNRRFFISFLILLGTSLFYSYHSAKQKIVANELVEVWVVKETLLPPVEIEAKNLEAKYFPKKNLPIEFYESKENLVGKILIAKVVENQILLPHYFSESVDENSISTRFGSRFALTMDEDWFEAKLPELAKNDLIDILITNPKRNISETVLIARNLPIIEIQIDSKNNKKTLVVNTSEEAARAILFVRGAHLPMHILVHSSLPLTENNDADF